MGNITWQSQSHKGVTKVTEWSCHSHITHRVTSYGHSMWQRSQLTSMRTVGAKVHSHNSNCIYSVAKSNGDSIEFSLSIAEQKAVGFIPAWSLASLQNWQVWNRRSCLIYAKETGMETKRNPLLRQHKSSNALSTGQCIPQSGRT